MGERKSPSEVRPGLLVFRARSGMKYADAERYRQAALAAGYHAELIGVPGGSAWHVFVSVQKSPSDER